MGITRTPHGTFTARWTDPWGRRTSRTFKTMADARAHLRRAYGDMARGEYVDRRRGKTTLADWADDWLAGARNVGTGGREMYEQALAHILPELGRIPLGKLSATDIDRYLTGKLAPGRGFEPPGALGTTAVRAGSPRPSSPAHRSSTLATRGVLAPSTVHRHYRTLHRMLKVAVERGMIPRNPCEHVEPPRIPRAEMTVLDAGQVDALAAAITPRYRAWVYVMAYGGLRWSESVGLRRCHVQISRDDSRCQLLITEQLVRRGKGEWDRCEPKAGSRRTVTLPAFAAGELAAHLDIYSVLGDDGLVFPTRNGTPMQAGSWRTNTFGRALAKAGLPTIRVHDLRHTAISLAIEAGANPKLSQARAGHSSIGIHLDRYGHLFPGADEAVARALDELHAKAQRGRLRAV